MGKLSFDEIISNCRNRCENVKNIYSKLDGKYDFRLDSVYKENSQIIECIQELKRYRDLEGQCIKENSFGLRMLLHKRKEFIEDIHELYEYRKLKNKGKLLKLPCEIGSRVYMIYSLLGEGEWEIEEHKIKLEDLENIGKTVFLTRDQAEAELKNKEVKEQPRKTLEERLESCCCELRPQRKENI